MARHRQAAHGSPVLEAITEAEEDQPGEGDQASREPPASAASHASTLVSNDFVPPTGCQQDQQQCCGAVNRFASGRHCWWVNGYENEAAGHRQFEMEA